MRVGVVSSLSISYLRHLEESKEHSEETVITMEVAVAYLWFLICP